MQLSTISLALTRLGGLFSPASLFAGGTVPGAWYDPSDLSTLFQDSAGTTPVTGVEQVVGLMLDKSKGLVLGPELVTNGDFSGGTTTGWIPSSATISVVGGQAELVSTVNGTFQVNQQIAVTAGRFYRFSATLRRGTCPQPVYIGFNGGASVTTNSTTDVVVTAIIPATASPQNVQIYTTGASIGQTLYFDNISVRELPGNHATSTGPARPTLSARVNLLTKTEQFDDGAWTKGAGASATTSKLSAIAGTGAHWIFQNVVPNARCVFSVEAQADTANWLAIGQGFTTASFNAFFDLTNGVAYAPTSPVGSTASIEPLGGGWFRCITTIDVTAGGMSIAVTNANNVAVTYNATGTEAINIRKADARPANDGVGIPAYQRVNTATDYDSSGFPLYLRFGGTQAMSTGSIDFTATDKMSVFAGVRKLSDAANGMLTELSDSSSTNNSTFAYSLSSSGADSFWRSKGTASASGNASGTPAAPVSIVATGIGNISGDISQLYENRVLTFNSTADQGTGNFGNYPLYIGARNLASLFFNGRLYSLIGVGSAVSAGNISATESWVNGRTKAF